MKPLDYWVDGLKSFFEHVETDLAAMLDANGCREGWLQGEALLFFRNRGDAFYVNYERLSVSTKADFAAYSSHGDDAVLWMLGEMKVLGVKGYQEKVLGLPIQPFIDRIHQGEQQLVMPPLEEARGWGLFSDYCRLRDYQSPPQLPRLLVLVLDTRKTREADRLGRVLQAIDFDAPALVLRQTDHFIAKCWPVRGRN